MFALGLAQDRGPRILDQVLLGGQRVGRQALRRRRLQMHPARLGIQVRQPGERVLELVERLLLQVSDPCCVGCRQGQAVNFRSGNKQCLEPAEVSTDECLEDFLAHFLCRDHPPGIDLVVLVDVHAPFHTAGVQPAILIGLPLSLGVGLAVDLDTVLVVAPDMRPIISLSVHQSAQQSALRVEEQPRPSLVLPLDFALLLFRGCWRAVNDSLLLRTVLKDLRRGRRAQGRSDPANEDNCQQRRTDACLRHPILLSTSGNVGFTCLAHAVSRG